MKTPVPQPVDRIKARQAERQKMAKMTRALEEMAADSLQQMAEQGQFTGRFSWDGITGDFATSPLVTTLTLSDTHGSITAHGKLRNAEWTLSVSVNLPEFALKPYFSSLVSMLEALSIGDLHTIPNTVH